MNPSPEPAGARSSSSGEPFLYLAREATAVTSEGVADGQLTRAAALLADPGAFLRQLESARHSVMCVRAQRLEDSDRGLAIAVGQPRPHGSARPVEMGAPPGLEQMPCSGGPGADPDWWGAPGRRSCEAGEAATTSRSISTPCWLGTCALASSPCEIEHACKMGIALLPGRRMRHEREGCSLSMWSDRANADRRPPRGGPVSVW